MGATWCLRSKAAQHAWQYHFPLSVPRDAPSIINYPKLVYKSHQAERRTDKETERQRDRETKRQRDRRAGRSLVTSGAIGGTQY